MLEEEICEILKQQFKCDKYCKANFKNGVMVDYCYAIKRIIRITSVKQK